MAAIILRKALYDDLEDIYNLVHKLAIFEKEPDAMTVSIEEYKKAFHEGLIEAIVAESEDQIIGMVLYYMTFSTWKGKCLYLEDFYVKTEFRKSGIGQQLFDAFLNAAMDKGAQMTKWQVLDWNEIGLSFYEKNKALIEKNWWNGKIYF